MKLTTRGRVVVTVAATLAACGLIGAIGEALADPKPRPEWAKFCFDLRTETRLAEVSCVVPQVTTFWAYMPYDDAPAIGETVGLDDFMFTYPLRGAVGFVNPEGGVQP